MSTEEYEYLVRRPKFQNDGEFEALLNEQGAGGWILVSLLPQQTAEDIPYLAVFYRRKLGT